MIISKLYILSFFRHVNGLKTKKVSTISSGKIGTYEHLTVEEMVPSDQSQIRKQVKLTYYTLEKASKK